MEERRQVQSDLCLLCTFCRVAWEVNFLETEKVSSHEQNCIWFPCWIYCVWLSIKQFRLFILNSKEIYTGLNFLTFCLKMSEVDGQQPRCFMSIHFLVHLTIGIRHPKITTPMETYRALPPKEGSSHIISSSSRFMSGSLLHLRECKISSSIVTSANSLCCPYVTDKMAKWQYLVLSNEKSSAASRRIWTHSFISLTSHLCYRKSWSESKWKHAER